MMQFDFYLFIVFMMNGWKLVIFFEEVGLDYELMVIDFVRKEQKVLDYFKINFNGCILVFIDWFNDDFVIFEFGVILWYLVEKYG